MSELEGKRVVVTGAAGGIGRALCRLLADEGCRLGLLDLNGEALQAMADELRETGAEVALQAHDLRDRPATLEALGAISEQLGPVDVLIYNAGVAGITDARDPQPDYVEEMLEVNYVGGLYAIEAVLPSMLERGSGHLVVISSLAARRGLPWMAGYCASKAAVTSFMESLRPPLRQRGVLVTTCHPGFVMSPMLTTVPFRGVMLLISAHSAAYTIVRGIKRKRREVNFPWFSSWWINVGRHLPNTVFDWLMVQVGKSSLTEEY